jgi:hypothetical protein
VSHVAGSILIAAAAIVHALVHHAIEVANAASAASVIVALSNSKSGSMAHSVRVYRGELAWVTGGLLALGVAMLIRGVIDDRRHGAKAPQRLASE